MAIMDLIESRWEELAGVTPLKDCYPAIENHERKIVTGCVSKNTRWNYHNGGSWPGYLVAKMMLENPSHLGMIVLEDDKQMKPVMRRSNSWTC
ncbi:hypothetical protein ACFX2A_003488 [Malus domestica]